jgi:hypothetical protein
MLPQMNEIVAVRHVGGRDRVEPRAVDEHAVAVEHADQIGLRQVRQPVGEEAMDVFRAHPLLELLRRCDPLGEDFGLQLLQHQIDGLDRARRLLGEHDPEIADLATVAGRYLVVTVPGGQRRRRQGHEHKDEPGDRKAPARRRQAFCDPG